MVKIREEMHWSITQLVHLDKFCQPIESSLQENTSIYQNHYAVIFFFFSPKCHILKTLNRNTLWAHIHLPGIHLWTWNPQVDQLGNHIPNWAASLFSSEQFCALGKVSPSVLPTLWGGLGLAVWSLAPSQLQLDFGTDGTERLKDEKSGEEGGMKA